MKVHYTLFLCATLPILYAEECKTTDDVLAMLQNSLRVKTQDDETGLPEKISSDRPDMKNIGKLEELVMARVRDEKVEGNDKIAKTLNATVKTFFASIISQTAANQRTIVSNVRAFKRCKTSMWSKYKKAIPMERDHWIMGLVYPKCIRAENKLEIVKRKNDKEANTYTSNLKTKKKLAKIEENKCGNICKNQKFENYHEQLESLMIFYNKCKQKIGPRIKDVKKGSDNLKKKMKDKKLSDAKYLAMKNKCDKIAYVMNGYKCKAVTTLDGSCSFYEACWKRAKKQYDRDKKVIIIEERDFKIQWRALRRIQCYLLVMGTKNDKNHKKEKAQLDQCIKLKKKDISTKHLDINYKRIPPKPKCPKDPMCPCSKFYTNSYYKVGPKSRCVKNLVKKYTCPACKGKKKR